MGQEHVRFDTLLARADEETLQRLLGRRVLRLLQFLDPSLTRPTTLRRLLIDLSSPSELLRNATARRELLMLMRPDEALQFIHDLPLSTAGLSTQEVYEAISHVDVLKGSVRERRLYDLLAVPLETTGGEDLTVRPKSTIDINPEYGLFPHQRDAVARVLSSLEHEPRRVLLHMPTGSGKTRVAMNVIADNLRRYEHALVIWLAYSEELCEQAVEEFQRAWSVLGNRKLGVHRFWGPHDLDFDHLSNGLLVAGLSKMYNVARTSVRRISSLADKVTMVIIDEAHLAVAETYALTLDVLSTKRPDTKLLGLTATPGRTWADIEADEELSRFFARRKVTLRVAGYENPIDYLIDEGYLSRAEFRSLLYEGGYVPSARDLEHVSNSLDVPLAILNRLAQDEQRNLVIVRELEQLANNHTRILFFAATVDHARLVATVLRARGLEASAVTAETSPLERSRIITRFRGKNSGTQVLCNYGVLTAGFDAPATSAAVIARPTTSLILYSQMVGRAIRGPKMGGTERCEVVTVVDRGLPGFGSVAESFVNWQDIWEEAES